ncbi:outer membrane protein assembly factor BamA [Verminephrobacter aporrectodeae]|uniref:Outer membrane protein assembly factor BamA n=1 Tax=Verminephrobacter aporrectodeae subsp. tuberculatae TaxID=1110392 RepID=A0ABT3KQY8_9BURK|nr:outer membrane protein assembly factor BamA [Verminephrobacter aporrectodeae]MCW5220310.1 outer membrane protein assembly factor BamA [Verminephrobacter aporrectodeae subsp. tuberculatae]MCW5255718.1 outer membrane protein assembly factor BamA [Verminephrobacter aporrectodeae subsp. tuberculatae]MCW5289604.1 outer membrane protein assembly factor BamA [Verminephrobacter aporrectodeae subsp. tuberculatae]MCW5320739.1 outer membrane protein assembly factor BamA [Verminephrobacter aporrectodeae
MTQHIHRLGLRAASAASALLTLFLAAGTAWALEPFKVQDIRVEGLQRVEPGTVFASLPLRVGDDYDDEKGAAAIRALFALGLFKDVRLEASGNVLRVLVQERPTIADVDFAGTREFDKDVLKKTMRDVGLAEGRPYDKALTDRAEQELKRQYINKSLYGAEVLTTVTPVERNRVNLSFTVVEGEPARIKEIRVVGNKAFSESTLKGLFDQDTGGWLSWYTKSDRYSRAKLDADLQTLRSYYLERGYLEFRVDSTQVAISPDKQDISIAVNVTEGARYVVSGVKLEGDYLERDDEFKALVAIRPGEPYNAEQVTQTTKAFSEYFARFGFAFARVEAVPEIDRENNRVAFIVQADPARRAYVRRINVSGNNRTRDEVIRREFRQYEASWYDGDKIRLSRDRVDRLGFFSEVHVETQEVPGSPDQVDLVINVVEKPSGSLQMGVGFSTAEKVSLSLGFTQENIFGSGNYLGVDVNTSKYRRTLVFSTTNPYFTPEGISRTLDLYYRTDRPYEDQGGNYQLITMGGAVRFGVPFSETDTVFYGGGIEQTRIRPGTNIPATYLSYAEHFGYSSLSAPLTLGWSRDDRDSALVPNSGRYQRLNSDWSVAGDTRYLRANYQFQQYVPLNKRFTVAFNSELGLGKGINGRPFPVFKNFYSGGLGSVRGFDQGTLGPRDVTGASLGGPKKLTLNAELIAPFPGAGNDRTLRVFTFADLGNVFGENEKIAFKDLRASVGLGLSWISPLGPLRLAFAQPVRKFAGDRIQKLQFQIGTSF